MPLSWLEQLAQLEGCGHQHDNAHLAGYDLWAVTKKLSNKI